jgi:uncharacterized protein (DUF2384 family)
MLQAPPVDRAGGPVATTALELQKKAAADTIAWAHDALALAFAEIGRAVEADERTVRRWHGREVLPRRAHQAKLEALRDLRHLLGEVFASEAEAAEWLHTPLRAFRGQTPISVIRRGRLTAVVEALATMESGAFL